MLQKNTHYQRNSRTRFLTNILILFVFFVRFSDGRDGGSSCSTTGSWFIRWTSTWVVVYFLFPILRNACARRVFLFITVSMCVPRQPEKKSSAGREGAVDVARVGAKYTIFRRVRVQPDPPSFFYYYIQYADCRRIIRPSSLREKSYVHRPLPTVPSTSFRENTIETLLFLIPHTIAKVSGQPCFVLGAIHNRYSY